LVISTRVKIIVVGIVIAVLFGMLLGIQQPPPVADLPFTAK